MMHTIHVPAPSRAYDVLVGPDVLGRAGPLCGDILPGRRVLMLTDTNVAPLYADTLEASLRESGFETLRHVVEAGEKSKDGAHFLALLSALARAGLTRADAVLALGGGVVGDLAGFAASAYLRGVHLVQVPTSLLAQVDASVGGKTAIDLDEGKNLAGSFYAPHRVLCDTRALETLPDVHRQGGMAEVIKYGVIYDARLFESLEEGPASLTPVIVRCIEIKRDLVCEDERDRGVRQWLNFGHTPGHAVESLSGYTIPHGHAVAMGMAVMARAAFALGLCPRDCPARLEALLRANGLPIRSPFPPDALARAAASDKKRAGNEVQIVVPERIGACRLWAVPVSSLGGIFEKGMTPLEARP